MSALRDKIAGIRARQDADRRAEALEEGVYFNESARWWFAEAGATSPRILANDRDVRACFKAGLDSAGASHLSALRIIALEGL